MTERVPPHSIEAEQAILGAVLRNPSLWPSVVAETTDRAFYRRAHADVFAAMCDVAGRNLDIDVLTVCESLRVRGRLDDVGGVAYVSSLTDGVPRTSNVSSYVKIINEKSRLRLLLKLCSNLVDEVYEEEPQASVLVDKAVQRLIDLVETDTQEMASIKRVAEAYLDSLIAGTASQPITTGYIDLDKLIGGFNPSELIVIAARPSTGKTTFVLGSSWAIARRQMTSPFFSLEVPATQLASKIVSWESGVPSVEIDRGTASAEQFATVAGTRVSLPDAPLFVNVSARTVSELGGWCRRLKQESGALHCVVIDYLQLLMPDDKIIDKEERVAAVSRGLKRLAMDLKVPVVALSQLNRSSDDRRDKRPHLSDLRGSGALEQDADVAILLFREEMYVKRSDNHGIAEAIVAKNRNGPTGTVKLQFDHRLAKFNDLSTREDF